MLWSQDAVRIVPGDMHYALTDAIDLEIFLKQDIGLVLNYKVSVVVLKEEMRLSNVVTSTFTVTTKKWLLTDTATIMVAVSVKSQSQ